jgi:hypothetical protein
VDDPNPGAPPGYGEEPEFEHDPTSFEVDGAAQDYSNMGSNGDHNDQKDTGYSTGPGIQMKDDG